MRPAVAALLVSLPGAARAWNVRVPPSWSNRLGLTITPIATGVWAAERAFRRFNVVDVGARAVFARASDGSLIVHCPGSPIEFDSDLMNGVAALGGGVGYIIGSGKASDLE